MYNIYEMNNEQQGACVSSRLRLDECPDLQPDLDNANVGKEMRKC